MYLIVVDNNYYSMCIVTINSIFSCVFYRKLLDPGLAACSKPSMFLNLVYKSLKADVVLRRVKAFVKRLLQVACGQTPPFICGTLYLLSELLKVKPGLRVQLQDHMVQHFFISLGFY